MRHFRSGSLLKKLESVIPNGVCEVSYGFPSHVFRAMNLSFFGILIEEGFLASPACRRQAGNDTLNYSMPLQLRALAGTAKHESLEQFLRT